MTPSMSAGPAAVFANLLASLGGPRWAGPRLAVAARLSGRRSVNQLSAVLGAAASVVHIASQLDGDLREEEGLVEDQQANTAGIPFAQPDDEDEWMSYVDLGDIEASWPSGTSWPSSSGDV